MTEQTKHKIAKEIYLFFKWILFGFIVYVGLIALSLLLFVLGFEKQLSPYKHEFWDIVEISPILTVLCFYLYRLYKWVMKYK